MLAEITMVHDYRCPSCGTKGVLWNKNPQTFKCPRCYTFYSKFGIVLETSEDGDDVWT